jgi:NAD(P)-dependent dehydrogenase (short-subunit alcohol dehydrogenase family)
MEPPKKLSVGRTLRNSLQRMGSIRSFVFRAGLFSFVRLRICQGAVAPSSSPRSRGVMGARSPHPIGVSLNVLDLILCSQQAADCFGANGGSIINISSITSTAAPPMGSVYSATKAAVDAVTKSLAKELGPRNIRLNAINPGMVETEGVHAARIAEINVRKQVEAQTPLGRIGQPEDIAGAAVFLASPSSAWITAETFVIAGGFR